MVSIPITSPLEELPTSNCAKGFHNRLLDHQVVHVTGVYCINYDIYPDNSPVKKASQQLD